MNAETELFKNRVHHRFVEAFTGQNRTHTSGNIETSMARQIITAQIFSISQNSALPSAFTLTQTTHSTSGRASRPRNQENSIRKSLIFTKKEGSMGSSTSSEVNYLNENISRAASDYPIHTFRSPFLMEEEALVEKTKTRHALIILNSPIKQPPSKLFCKLWEIASVRICADGGANRLYHATNNNDTHSSGYIPDLICGDLDSLEPNIRKYYEQKGVRIQRNADQNFNDLDKALTAIPELISEWKEMDPSSQLQINVYGAFGGRFDQEMASIQALYRWKDEFDFRIALYTDDTFAILLPKEYRNEIHLPFTSQSLINEENNLSGRIGEGPTTGLIPIGCTCLAKTEGFKWNLDGSIPLEFGGLVSTSNRAEESVLIVQSSEPLVFTAEITEMN